MYQLFSTFDNHNQAGLTVEYIYIYRKKKTRRKRKKYNTKKRKQNNLQRIAQTRDALRKREASQLTGNSLLNNGSCNLLHGVNIDK